MFAFNICNPYIVSTKNKPKREPCVEKRGRKKTTQVIPKPNQYPNQNGDPKWEKEGGKDHACRTISGDQTQLLPPFRRNNK